jgi:hypothetical protein
MRGLHRKGWQRIGIALSVIWAIGGSLWLVNDASNKNPSYSDLAHCTYETDTDKSVCERLFDIENGEVVAALRTNTVVFVLLPIFVVWLLAYLLVITVRWIRHGFNPS